MLARILPCPTLSGLAALTALIAPADVTKLMQARRVIENRSDPRQMNFNRIGVRDRHGFLAIVDPVDVQIVRDVKLGHAKIGDQPVNMSAHGVEVHLRASASFFHGVSSPHPGPLPVAWWRLMRM